MSMTLEKLELLSDLSTEQLLLAGGDARLAVDHVTGLNKYGCASQPDVSLAAFGSSTGSTISEHGYAAAHNLHKRLLELDSDLSESDLYHHELERIRHELNRLNGIDYHHAGATIFAASGTDLHLICSQLLADSRPGQPPLHIIMMDACETGSGVAPAVRGQHFSGNAALGGKVVAMETLAGANPVVVSSIALRNSDGSKRTLDEIDAETEQLIQASLADGQRVLLIMIDVSKTGLIAPAPHYVAALRQRYPDQVDVLVDACQFRLSGATLNAYLQKGCMVAMTGSKFLTGPVFSGVLQIPSRLVPRLSQKKLPASMADYSARAEWPQHWQAVHALSDQVNWGLLLRLEAALAELRAFRAIPETRVSAFLERFCAAVQQALQTSPHFLLMAESRLDRSPICSRTSWDQIPTIFPFLLLHQSGQPLTRAQTQQIYQQLQFALPLSSAGNLSPAIAALRCQLGQPVLCGTHAGTDVSALRLCASSRLIVEACKNQNAEADTEEHVIQRAMQVLEKASSLIRKLC